MDWTRIDKQALKRSIEIQLAVGGGLWMDHIEGCFNYFEWFPYDGGIFIGTGKQVVHLIALHIFQNRLSAAYEMVHKK